MKGKNVDFDSEKWKNEMTHPEFEPGTFSTGVRCPYPYTTDSLENLAKWQNVVNIKAKKIQIFKGP